jgi:hypothetical protein
MAKRKSSGLATTTTCSATAAFDDATIAGKSGGSAEGDDGMDLGQSSFARQ